MNYKNFHNFHPMIKSRNLSSISNNECLSNNSTKSILLEEPSTYTPLRRVSFCLKPEIKRISYNNGIPTKPINQPEYEVKDKKIIFSLSMKTKIKNKASHYISKIETNEHIILKYRRKSDLEADLRALGLLSKTYLENKIIVKGLGYRENEESVKEYFSQFGKVEKVVLEKNLKNRCTGRGTITFFSNINTSQPFRLNNRLLFIERIKKQHVNTTRLHISHIYKNINISKLRLILKSEGFVPKNIRIDLFNGKNPGYGFVEFKNPEEASKFIDNFDKLKILLGPESYVEFSKEKNEFI